MFFHFLFSNCMYNYRKDPCTPLLSNWSVTNKINNKVKNPNGQEVVIQKHYWPNMKLVNLSTNNSENWKIINNPKDPNDPNGILIYKGIKAPNYEK